MSTVIARRIRSAPHRPAVETWKVISQLLSQGDVATKKELDSVAGIVASTIVDQVTENSPIVVSGKGPRIRFYCLYGDEAISGDDANEDALPVKPLEGEWMIQVPFVTDEYDWAVGALKSHSTRIKPYDPKSGLDSSNSTQEQSSISLDLDALSRL